MIRNILVASVFLLVTSVAQAQQHALDTGSLQISGSASFISQGDDDDSNRITSISLNPQVQYFVAQRLSIGAELNLSYSSFGNDASARGLGIGPSLTYYSVLPKQMCTRTSRRGYRSHLFTSARQ